MKDTAIENLSWEKCVALYDRETTFFYLDPPYTNHLNDYGQGIFDMKDLETMSGLLKNISGRFMLTMNDSRENRELFGSFALFNITTNYCCNKGPAKKNAAELLVTNYMPDTRAIEKAGIVRIQP